MNTIAQINNRSMNHYTLEGEIKVSKDINLTLEEVEILAMIGPSGCGKSTIMNSKI